MRRKRTLIVIGVTSIAIVKGRAGIKIVRATDINYYYFPHTIIELAFLLP